MNSALSGGEVNWWVPAGRYWYDASDYAWSQQERDAALEVAHRAVAALRCTYLVVDVAQTATGRWIIVECNDGMESGYAGASPFAIWQAITDYEVKS